MRDYYRDYSAGPHKRKESVFRFARQKQTCILKNRDSKAGRKIRNLERVNTDVYQNVITILSYIKYRHIGTKQNDNLSNM